MVKMWATPPKINILQFFTATATLLLALPDRRRRGWGWGWGCRGRGRGRRSWVRAEGDSGNFWPFIGRLPDHSSLALLKNFNFCHRPTPPPLHKIYIKPPPRHYPYQNKLGGVDILFVRYSKSWRAVNSNIKTNRSRGLGRSRGVSKDA
jgi:hypothetical protein